MGITNYPNMACYARSSSSSFLIDFNHNYNYNYKHTNTYIPHLLASILDKTNKPTKVQMLPSSRTTLTSSSCAGNSARHSDGSLSDGDDIFMTIDTNNGTEFFAVEPPRVLDKNESFQKERQISVDPISLQASSGPTVRQASFRLVSPPTKGSGFNQNHPVPSPPSKLKFVSTSLPSSTSSSPSSPRSKNPKPSSNSYPNKIKSGLSRMQSAMDDSHIPLREVESRRSRSYCEPRSSNTIDDFDLWLPRNNNNNPFKSQNSMSTPRNFSKPPLGKSKENQEVRKSKGREKEFPEDGFKCGKLCLFLPRKGGKPVRSSSSASTQVSHISHGSLISRMTEPPVISRTVSLERFECGSWSENEEGEGGESPNLFFDLPMELLRCSVSDMQSPVTAAFVFDDDNDNGHKDKEMIGSDIEAFLEAQAT